MISALQRGFSQTDGSGLAQKDRFRKRCNDRIRAAHKPDPTVTEPSCGPTSVHRKGIVSQGAANWYPNKPTNLRNFSTYESMDV